MHFLKTTIRKFAKDSDGGRINNNGRKGGGNKKDIPSRLFFPRLKISAGKHFVGRAKKRRGGGERWKNKDEGVVVAVVVVRRARHEQCWIIRASGHADNSVSPWCNNDLIRATGNTAECGCCRDSICSTWFHCGQITQVLSAPRSPLSPSPSLSSFYIKTILPLCLISFPLPFFPSLSLLSLSLLARIHISWRRILKGLHKVKIDAWLKVYSVARFVPFRCAGSCARYTPPGETKVDIAKYVSRRLFFVIRPTFSTCCASNLIYSTRRESFNGMFQCNS